MVAVGAGGTAVAVAGSTVAVGGGALVAVGAAGAPAQPLSSSASARPVNQGRGDRIGRRFISHPGAKGARGSDT
jgi:hypothetical protein